MATMRRRLVWLFLVAACKPSSPAQSAAPPPASPASPPAASAAPAPAAAPEPTPEREGGGGLIDELAREAKGRPTGTPAAEAVLDALEAKGLKFERRRQVLARVVGASFCMTGLLAGGASISVCEYPDEAAAAKGRELSLEKFKALPNRQIFVNKKTTLTLTSTGDGASSDVADKVKTTFSAM
jgi:hypothetical protein